jgi:hypothetical protein
MASLSCFVAYDGPACVPARALHQRIEATEPPLQIAQGERPVNNLGTLAVASALMLTTIPAQAQLLDFEGRTPTMQAVPDGTGFPMKQHLHHVSWC